MSNVKNIRAFENKIANLEKNCKNLNAVKEYINTYRDQTKSAVENILNMSETVNDLHLKVKSNILDESDLNYFCYSVGLSKNSSSFRKYICIANNSAKFREYLERMPSASSVLYEITTLDPEKFDYLIKNNILKQTTTLKEIKQLSGKACVPNKNINSQFSLNIQLDENQIEPRDIEIIQHVISLLKNIPAFKIDCKNADFINQNFMKDAA